jgi:hypothetical protein
MDKVVEVLKFGGHILVWSFKCLVCWNFDMYFKYVLFYISIFVFKEFQL